LAKILVTDNISQFGIDLLSKDHQVDIRLGLSHDELRDIVSEYSGLVVRSETKITEDIINAGSKLRVIARAGIGVDNIDVSAATNVGIAVVNAPTGNIIAAAEHTIALILASARNIPQAYLSMKDGKWNRSTFMGSELRGKTLGIIGIGRVGSEVAKRARSFDMEIIAYDPFVSGDYATRIGITLQTLEELLSKSDFISIHTPLTESTESLLGPRQFSLMKNGCRLINVARGELIDDTALFDALSSGKVSVAALDVFRNEPDIDNRFTDNCNIILTPHLGGATIEAQDAVAIEAVEQLINILQGSFGKNVVNAPMLGPDNQVIVSPMIPVAEMMGKLAIGLSEGQFRSVTLSYEGEIAEYDTSVLKSAFLSGFMQGTTSEQVNSINAPILAKSRGLELIEQKQQLDNEFSSLITVILNTSNGQLLISGTFVRGQVHLVRFNEYWLDIALTDPTLLFVDNDDRPGSIGAVGTVAGKHNVNINFMEVGRIDLRGRAMMVLGVDDYVPVAMLDDMRELLQIHSVKLVRIT
jgi:D-3-phosphoglycerate dehydrogenase